MTTGIGAGRGDVISVLLPDATDAGMEALAFSTFIDGACPVEVSPVDQLLVAFCRHVVCQAPAGGVAVLQLPRARHRVALTLAICMHLLRIKERFVSGPVVFAAQDVDMSGQLRALRMRNHGSISLGRDNPLSAQRLTRTGDLAPLIGSSSGQVNSSFIYFSTRIGSPRVDCKPPLVIVDATSIRNPESRARVLTWATNHSAVATIIVGDIGDESLVQTVNDSGRNPLVFPLTQTEVGTLIYHFNRRERSASALSSMWMLWQDEFPGLSIHGAGDAEFNGAIARAFACLASRPRGPMPMPLDHPSKLLNAGTRLAATVEDYRRACALASRPGEGPGGLRNLLRHLDFKVPPGPWQAWGIARWGELKIAVETIWRQLDESNPKLNLLWSMLDQAYRDGCGQILIRCHSEAAATATRSSLTGTGRTAAQISLWDRIADRVEIATYAKRYPPGSVDVQILTGNPPPSQFSLLFSGEASATWVLAYDAEQTFLKRELRRWRDRTDARRKQTFQALGADEPAPVHLPKNAAVAAAVPIELPELRLPGLSILDVLDRVSTAIDSPAIEGGAPNSWRGSGTTCSCVPVELDDNRTWWVRNETDCDGELATPVLVYSAAGQRYLPLRELSRGDTVIVPAGDGTESVHARLVAVSHSNDDVASLDAILEQFRAAARKVQRDKGTKRAAIEAVRDAGAHAAPQLGLWASGQTIAPRDPDDIAAVFRAAHQPVPNVDLLHNVAGTLRSLHRDLGHFVTALASGRTDEAAAQLHRLIGQTADELLDEFVFAEVVAVGRSTKVPSNLVGRLRASERPGSVGTCA